MAEYVKRPATRSTAKVKQRNKSEQKGAPAPGAPCPSLRKCGPQAAEPSGSLNREDYVILMPAPQFEAWVTERLHRVAGNREAEASEQHSIEADRRLRVWAREEGKRLHAQQRAELTPATPSQSESPLEERLLQAFLSSGQFERLRVPSDIVVAHGAPGLLLQQLWVTTHDARHRLDFALVNPSADVFVAVEVDGVEWHDRTPEQAERDKSRDRKLTASGWLTLRFAGREVHRDPAACVAEVLSVVEARAAESKAG
jgi:hypothetical protein